jgi:REP element-mobilizing transposase RayT
MSHSKVEIWIHAVIGVKYRRLQITEDIENEVYRKIFDKLVENGCYVEAINGIENHIHLLFRIKPTKSISEVIKNVKGSVSYYINKNKLTKNKFSWQVGYGAFSVSESGVNRLKSYISNQKEHHNLKPKD